MKISKRKTKYTHKQNVVLTKKKDNKVDLLQSINNLIYLKEGKNAKCLRTENKHQNNNNYRFILNATSNKIINLILCGFLTCLHSQIKKFNNSQ